MVVEGSAPDRRGAGVDNRSEQVPARQLQHTGTHQAVGGERVGSPCASARARRRAARPEPAAGRSRRRLPGPRRPRRRRRSRCGPLSARGPASAGSAPVIRWATTSRALCRAPSMKPESRRCWKRWPTTYTPGARVTPRYCSTAPNPSVIGQLHPRVVGLVPRGHHHGADSLGPQVEGPGGGRQRHRGRPQCRGHLGRRGPPLRRAGLPRRGTCAWSLRLHPTSRLGRRQTSRAGR